MEWLNSGSYLATGLTTVVLGLTAGFVAYKGAIMATTIWNNIFSNSEIIKKNVMFAGQVLTKSYAIVMGLLKGQTMATTLATLGLSTATTILLSPIGLIVGAL